MAEKCICGGKIIKPEQPAGEDNFSTARWLYGSCQSCRKIQHPGNRGGHSGSLDVHGNWICDGACRVCHPD
ncbi:MAG TPA: hypothetical protein VK255_02325 [Patescibacteria group bacterium]|nr:hypothetical protein [Patescibacteria group bacterium]